MREFKSYEEMNRIHQEEYNALPIVYMFGRKTDEEIAEALKPIKANSIHECVSLFGAGDVMRQEDVPAILKCMRKHTEEKKLFQKNNLVSCILTEMYNYEYSYAYEKEDVLNALGRTYADFEDETFRKAWQIAEAKCLGE